MLIELAHPRFREELARRATELGYLGRHEHLPGV
jgi:acyl-CoA hydrolase